MSQPDALADAMDAIAVICDETLGALKKQASGELAPLDEADKAKLVARLDAHAARLKSVAEAGPTLDYRLG